MNVKNMSSLAAVAGSLMFAANAANAAVIVVNSNITTSTTWTNNNVYRLQGQIYVLNGATLTIQPGTVIASTPTVNGSGSLAITRGSKIIANGTCQDPIIFTSTADVNTWAALPAHPTGRNPKTGTWREACNEWGNVTIMGQAYISNSHIGSNSATFSANNLSPMEGLVPDFVGDPKTLYGGGNDDDDSGSLKYVSLRYGGRVVGLANELNGLSLGGVGRETDISHIEIMNNVDDGIEIWGGTVNIKYFNIWNIGDDSFDIDQGWRGKAQFGLIVQGHSVDAAQGSGVGDNIFEMDGAENSDAQPVTTAVIYNVTSIGQPSSDAGDHGTAWRDNARVQFRNCIFMDLGDRLVSFDNLDGDGSQGYGFNGTLSWANTWTTAFSVFSSVNAPPNPAQYYTAQTSGRLIQITDSVMFRNLGTNAYTEANARNVFAAANNNVLIPGFAPADAPIQGITRGPAVTRGGTTQLPVTSLDPRPRNAALTSVGQAPNDGFFTPAAYRGGFAQGQNWLCTWTATAAFGFNGSPVASCVPCVATPCPWDLNGDGAVGAADLGALLGSWGNNPGNPADFNGDGSVGPADLGALLGAWGNCP